MTPYLPGEKYMFFNQQRFIAICNLNLNTKYAETFKDKFLFKYLKVEYFDQCLSYDQSSNQVVDKVYIYSVKGQ